MENNDLLKNQYLTMSVMNDIYALPVSYVREVLNTDKITKLPGSPECIKGIINLRGRGIPVLDLKKQFGIEFVDDGTKGSIIVVDYEDIDTVAEERSCVFGLLADEVHEVIFIDKSKISPAPKIGNMSSETYLMGVGQLGEDFLLIIDINKLFREVEIPGTNQT